MPKLEVLGRTLRISYGNGVGTAFTMEVNNVQYLVTARHIFMDDYPSTAQIGIYDNKRYVACKVDIRYPKNKDIDIAVMRTNPYVQLTPAYPVTFASTNIAIGQDAYFLGFPYDYDRYLYNLPNSKRPMPLVKKVCVSGYIPSVGQLLLDGHNNPGFSGGPVCFQQADGSNYCIAGVIASYRYEPLAVCDPRGRETDMFVKANTGIVNAYDIKYAVDIAEAWG